VRLYYIFGNGLVGGGFSDQAGDIEHLNNSLDKVLEVEEI
jgi:hypothetical protein